MISDRPEWDAFISQHRWCVLTHLRSSGQPVSSMMAYAREGDTLVISTRGGTFKRRALERDPRMTLCIVSNSEPFDYVSVEGRVEIETTDLVGPSLRIFENLVEAGLDAPSDIEGWLRDQMRVILRLQPERAYGVIRREPGR